MNRPPGATGAAPTHDEVRAGLAAIVRAGPAALWGSETRGLLGIPAVQRHIADGTDTQAQEVLRTVLEVGIEQVGSHQYRHLLAVVLGLDPEYQGLSAQQRREQAGKYFRGGTTPISGGTVRQYHEPRALDELATVLLSLEADSELGPATFPTPLGEGQSLTCFVIGPIGSSHAELGSDARRIYEESLGVMAEVIEPACEAVGLAPVRADRLARAGEITTQIFRRLRDDDVVIADLTDANANVMYELGLRHTRDKLTIQIGEYDRLPFDVSTIRTIQFSRSTHGLIKARDQLVQVLKAGLEGAYDPVTPTILWNGDAVPLGDEITDGEQTRDEAGGEESLGFVDILAKSEEEQEKLVPALEDVAKCITNLGGLAQKYADELGRSDAAGKGMRGRLQVITRFAVDAGVVAEQLDSVVDHYVSVLDPFSAGMIALIQRMENDPDARDEAQEFGMLTRRTAAVTRESIAGLAGLVESIGNNASASRVLRGPSHRLTSALDRFVAATAVIDEWDRRLQVLGIPMPPEDWEPSSDEDDPAINEGPHQANQASEEEPTSP